MKKFLDIIIAWFTSPSDLVGLVCRGFLVLLVGWGLGGVLAYAVVMLFLKLVS